MRSTLRANPTVADRPSWPAGPTNSSGYVNNVEFRRAPLNYLQQNFRTFGDTFSYSDNTIVINDPAMIREVFIRSSGDFVADTPLFAARKRQILREKREADWMAGRRLGWTRVNRKMIDQHGETIVPLFDEAIKSASRETPGLGFDTFQVLRRYSGRMTAYFFLGSGSEDVAAAADDRSLKAVRMMASHFVFPWWFPHRRRHRVAVADQRLLQCIKGHVERRRASNAKEGSDLLGLLLSEDLDGQISTEQIINLIKVSLLASYGVPGAALSWIIRQMAERPEDRRAIASESRSHGTADVRQLSFTHAFVSEVLRIYPPTWLMGRDVARPCQLGDVSLQPGDSVMFSPYLVHHDPRWWPEPERFHPHRWLAKGDVQRHAYFPFGAGPRICLGAQLAMHELVTLTAHIALNYEVAVTDVGEPLSSVRPLLVSEGMRTTMTLRQ